MTAAIKVSQLTKTFKGGRRALSRVTFEVQPGEMVALIGASGSGKSTLLRNLSGLIGADRYPRGAEGRPANGYPSVAQPCCIDILGQSIQRGGRVSRDAAAIRSEIGFVFQQFNLVDRLSVLTNVLLGLLGRVPRWRGSIGLFTASEKLRAMDALARVGICETALRRAATLSGGQQQRAAIARTLVQEARIILADEPIASLDPGSSQTVMETLARINREDGVTVVTSLHQVDYARRYCPRTVALRDGQIVYDGSSQRLTPVFLRDLYGADCDELTGSPDHALNGGGAPALPPRAAVVHATA
ncbi:MAG: phosphonate ABC transporter ATP-binding protein [Alphaproteobacteria bacterium]